MIRMTRRRALAAGASALAALAGCTGPGRELPERPTGDWRHRAADAANTAAADVSVPPRGTPAWDAGEDRAAPLVADGTVYTVGGEVAALDAKTGEESWVADLEDGAQHAPALADGHLVVGDDRRVVALDPSDGSERWTASMDRIADGPVTAAAGPGIATVPVGETGLVGVDLASGDRLWTDDGRGTRQAAIADGTVYATGWAADGETGTLRALDPADGSRRWETDLDDPDAAPVVTGEGLLVADAGTLALHDPAAGDRRRELGSFGEEIWTSPAVADGTAYVAGDDGLVAVSLADGTVEWRADVTPYPDVGVTVGRDAVVAGDNDLPGVVAFERADGRRRWERQVDGFDAVVSTPPVLADGAVFYGSNESLGIVALGDLPPETE